VSGSAEPPRSTGRVRTGVSGGAPVGRSSGVSDGVLHVVDAVVLAGLLAFALVLRWPGLDPSSLWLDDAWVALAHRTSGWSELRMVGFSAPGFAALLKGWLGLVGFSELAAQIPALVAGVVSPAVAYAMAVWRGWHRAAGALAGVVLAVSPIAVTYATRVKQYTIEGLLALVLLGLALWLADAPDRAGRWAAFVGAGAVATVVSAFLAPYVGAGVLAGFVAALLARDGRAARSAVGWGALYGVAALGWYLAVLAPAVTTSISGFWADDYLTVDAGFGGFVTSLRSAIGGVVEGLLPVSPGVGVALLAIAVVLVVVLVLVGVAGRSRDGRAPVLLAMLLTPGVIAVVLAGLQLAPLGGGRTDLYLYPSLVLLLAAGADVGISLVGRWGLVAVTSTSLVALALAGWLVAGAERASDYPRYDVRPLVERMEEVAGEDEAILVYPATVWAYALYTSADIHLADDPVSSWGFSPRIDDPRVAVLPRGRDDPGAYVPTVAELRDGEWEVVWLLASHWREDLDALRVQLAEAGFSGEEVERRDGALLERYVRR